MPDPFTPSNEPYSLQRSACLMLDPEDDPIPEYCEAYFAQAGEPLTSEELGDFGISALIGGISAAAGAIGSAIKGKKKTPAERARSRRMAEKWQRKLESDVRKVRRIRRKQRRKGKGRRRLKRHDTGVSPSRAFRAAPQLPAMAPAFVAPPVEPAPAAMAPQLPAVAPPVEPAAPAAAFAPAIWYKAPGFTGLPHGVEMAIGAGVLALVGAAALKRR